MERLGRILFLGLIVLVIVLMPDDPRFVPDEVEEKPTMAERLHEGIEIAKKAKEKLEEEAEEVIEEPTEEVVEEEVVEEIVEEVTEETVETPELIYLGDFEITAYEWTGNTCANGEYPSENYTIACNSLPLGTMVYIEDVGYRVVEDRGATWHSDNWLDLYLGSVSECYEWGCQVRGVWLVE